MVDREEFNCPLCLKLLFAPVCTPCGHSFCGRCLQKALLLGNSCPMCRAPCFLKVDAVLPPLVLVHTLRASFPTEYAARGEEVKAEAEEARHERLGLFFLPDPRGPLQPGRALELHVFEPRYLLLMQRCLENGLLFGLQDGPDARCGVTARVREHLPLPRGRLLVRCAVGPRYRTLTPHAAPADGDYGLHYAPVYFVEDEAPEALVGVEDVEAVAAALRDAAAALGGGGNRLLRALERPLAGLALGAAAGALRGACLRATARLLAALPDADAARVHAQCGPPPSPGAPDEAASFWLASVLALSPPQRRAANDTVSSLVRFALCYGVLLCAEEQGAAARRRRGGAAGGGASGEGGGGGGVVSDAQNAALHAFEGVVAEDALSLFSLVGGFGGDDPDEDLGVLLQQGGPLALARWAFAKCARVSGRRLGHPLVVQAALLAALIGLLMASRQGNY
jgi:hypothetical protein